MNVGMLDYNPHTKLFLVKRVNIPNHVLEANAKKLLQKSQIDPSGSNTSIGTGKGSDKNEASSSGSEGQLEEKEQKSLSDGEREGEGEGEGEGSSGSEEEAGPASDGEQKAAQPQVPSQPVSWYNYLEM